MLKNSANYIILVQISIDLPKKSYFAHTLAKGSPIYLPLTQLAYSKFSEIPSTPELKFPGQNALGEAK